MRPLLPNGMCKALENRKVSRRHRFPAGMCTGESALPVRRQRAIRCCGEAAPVPGKVAPGGLRTLACAPRKAVGERTGPRNAGREERGKAGDDAFHSCPGGEGGAGPYASCSLLRLTAAVASGAVCRGAFRCGDRGHGAAIACSIRAKTPGRQRRSALHVRTVSTSRATLSGSASGVMPWPRLKM